MSKSEKTLSYEKALERLEEIVNALEQGELPLELAIEQYTQGCQLIATCQKQLDDAGLKIQTLSPDAGSAE